jgi:hypothetical protein
MANDFGTGQWVLDTTGDLTASPKKIKMIIFKPSAADDAVVLSDMLGHVFWKFSAAIAATPIGDKIEVWPEGQDVDGLSLTALSAGAELIIYFYK